MVSHSDSSCLEPETTYLEIFAPYRQKSLLHNSILHGYAYISLGLGVFFMLCYSSLRFITTGKLYWEEVSNRIEHNLLPDLGIVLALILLSCLLVMVPAAPVLRQSLAIFNLLIGDWALDKPQFQFSDRTLIVIITWSMFWKVYSHADRRAAPLPFLLALRFMLAPSLVFRVEFGRWAPDWQYVGCKLVAFCFCIVANLILLTDFIAPAIGSLDQSVLQTALRLIMPIFALSLLIFALVFEFILPILGEITQTPRRLQYGKWWEAETLGQAIGGWNRLTQEYLQEHLAPTIRQSRFFSEAFDLLAFISSMVVYNILFLQIFRKKIFSLGNTLVVGCIIVLASAIRNMRIGNYLVHYFFIISMPVIVAVQLHYDILQ